MLLGGSRAVALAGALLWGLGAALGFPVGMSAAADDPSRAAVRVSVVSSIGYTAFLAGPPLIGLLAEDVGILQRAVRRGRCADPGAGGLRRGPPLAAGPPDVEPVAGAGPVRCTSGLSRWPADRRSTRSSPTGWSVGTRSETPSGRSMNGRRVPTATAGCDPSIHPVSGSSWLRAGRRPRHEGLR